MQDKTDPNWAWLGRYTLLCFAAGALLLVWFIARCRRSSNPLLNLSLFDRNEVRYGALGIVLIGVGFYAVNWAFFQHTVNVWGWTISEAGLAT